jgi:flavin-dependent dehydrogenase
MTQITTQNGTFFANIVIGADGVNSIVARSLKLNKHRYEYAITGEVGYQKQNKDTDLLRIDWGYLNSGYAWSFPKKGFYSVGAGGIREKKVRLRNYLSIFIKKYLDITFEMEPSVFLNPLSFRQNSSPIQRGTCLLIGDAAGLIEPFTREGISSAIRSAQIGAKSILQALNKNTFDISGYELAIDEEIMCELNSAKKLRDIFDAFPMDFHNSLRYDNNLWNTFCEILRGTASYTTLVSGCNKKMSS